MVQPALIERCNEGMNDSLINGRLKPKVPLSKQLILST